MNDTLLYPKPLSILGVQVHRVTRGQALALIETFIASGQSHHVVTVNPEYVVMAQQDAAFRQMLNQADLALVDGVGLAWASWLLGHGWAPRIPGVDLMDWLAALAAEREYRIFLLGAKPGVAEEAAQDLQQRYPGLYVTGSYAGSPDPAEDAAILARIATAEPHLLFVAFGAPAQDIWIRRMLPRLGVPVAIGVGGAFDFLSGLVPRAPRWMRVLGLEWCFRLFKEPWRWRRMLRLPYFAWLVVRQRLKDRTSQ